MKQNKQGVKVGDWILCYFDDDETGRVKKLSGKVYEIDEDDPNGSPHFPTFRFKNYKGNKCWYFGDQIDIKNKK